MLKDILQRLLGHPAAPAIPVQPQPQTQPTGQPSLGQLTAALAKYQNNMPTENLDGSYNGQPVGTSIFKQTAQWFPPLKVGVTVPGDNIPRFDPLNSPNRLDDSNYPILKINPNSVPQPLPYMPYIGGNR